MISKKICFVANTGFALFNFRVSLIKLFTKKGWEVSAIACNEADYDKKFAEQGVKFINVPMDHKGLNPLQDLKLLLSLSRIYRKESPDIVHHFTIKPVIFGSIAAKIAGIPGIVNTITGLGYVFEKKGWLEVLTTKLYKIALSGRPRILFQNNDDRALFLQKEIVKSEQSCVILGSGIDTNTLRPDKKKNTNTSPMFLMVGRMLWSKGVADFVEAARIVNKLRPDAKFIMVGSVSGGGAEGNPQAIPQEWLEQVNHEKIVKWEGRVPFSRVEELMDQAMVVVLPSYREGVPRTLIEAAAKGKAIITTDVPGCREVVSHGLNGFLVPVKDVKALADSMLKFLSHPELIDKMGKSGRKPAVDLFDEKIVFEKTLKVYDSVNKAGKGIR
jgi:glycosyltransferase involved in cell wall biosynthesis